MDPEEAASDKANPPRGGDAKPRVELVPEGADSRVTKKQRGATGLLRKAASGRSGRMALWGLLRSRCARCRAAIVAGGGVLPEHSTLTHTRYATIENFGDEEITAEQVDGLLEEVAEILEVTLRPATPKVRITVRSAGGHRAPVPANRTPLPATGPSAAGTGSGSRRRSRTRCRCRRPWFGGRPCPTWPGGRGRARLRARPNRAGALLGSARAMKKRNLGLQNAPVGPESLDDWHWKARRVLSRFGPRTVPALVEALLGGDDPADPAVRRGVPGPARP